MPVDRLDGYHDEGLETLPWDEKRGVLERRLQRAVLIAFHRAPAMREKLQAARVDPGRIRRLQDLERVPITPKSSLAKLQAARPPLGGLLAVDPSELRRVYVSPGPIYDPEGRQPDFWRLQGVFYNAGLRPGDRILNTFSYHLTPGGLMCDEALTGLGCTVVPGGVGNADTQLQLLAQLRLNGYVGVPSFLLALIERAEQSGKDFRRDFNMEIAVTAGEMLTTQVRQTFKERHGILVRQFYATADVGAIAYECPEERGMHFADHRIVEVVDPATGKHLRPGEPGEVVVTLLDNPVYPLIRFGTGDLSAYDDAPCPCGRTSPRLTRLLGRVDQAAKVRGMFIHPSQVEDVAAHFEEIRLAQAVVERQDNRDQLTFRVVVDPAVSREGLAAKLQERIRSVMKLRAEVAFVSEGEFHEPQKRIQDLRRWE
jgi:phenylacetate-CoA ligase